MTSRVGTCADCSARFRIPDSVTAKRARCKKCGGVVEIPPVTVPEPERAAPDITVAGPPAKPASDGGTIEHVGHYRLIEELGRGGQAVVYLAEDTQIGRRVALKLLHATVAMPKETLDRFRREAEVAARLQHPGICSIYEAGELDGVPFIAMQYVEGSPLNALIRQTRTEDEDASFVELGDHVPDESGRTQRSKAPSKKRRGGSGRRRKSRSQDSGDEKTETDRIIYLVERAARALHEAHEEGLIHRDIKPHNLMVSLEGDPVLLDFGLARDMDDDSHQLTMTGDLMGTPAYMAPEQLAASRIELDRRTDVYSMGVLLYECLTLTVPFQAATIEALYQKILSEDPADPRRINSGVSADLKVVIETAMEKDRKRRYATAEQLAEDLRRVRVFEPIRARPASSAVKFKRWCQRNPVLATATLALFVLLSGGLSVTTVLLSKVSREKAAKEAALGVAQEERARAEVEATTANAVSEWLVNLFNVSDPSESRGNSITVREILDKGASELDEGLADQPKTRAKLMDTVGSVYRSLGLLSLAGPLLDKSLELRRDAVGSGTDLAESLSSVAAWHKMIGQLEEAETLYAEAIDMYRGMDPLDGRALGNVLASFGDLLVEAGRMDDAQAAMEEGLESLSGALGGDHMDIAVSHSNLGKLHYQRGDYAAAEQGFQDALAMARRLEGEDHPDVATFLDNIGHTHRKRGNAGAAELHFRKALAVRRRVLGEDHPQVGDTLNNLALVLWGDGDLDQAEELLAEALEIEEGRAVTDPVRAARFTDSLGLVLRDQGRLAESEQKLRSALALKKKGLGTGHSSVAKTLSNLGVVLREGGRLDEAAACYEEALEIHRTASGQQHPSFATALQNLGLVRNATGAFQEAEALLRQAVQIRRDVLGEAHWKTGLVQTFLGAALTGQGRFQDAFAALDEGRAVLEGALEPGHDHILGTFDLLADLYEEWGKPSMAQEWRRRSGRDPE